MTLSTPEVVLESRGLTCGFPSRRVLEGVEVTIKAGTVTGILGPNGSGKSTLLNTLCGLLAPLAGEIFVKGKRLAQLSSRERAAQLAFVPQQETTEFGFTGIEIAAMGRIARSTGLFESDEDRAIAAAALARVDAAEFANRRFRELSGGEQQRVLVARALAQETPVVLMDEPSSHLDLSHQAELARLIRELAGEGKAVLVAVHDLNWAAATVDEAVLLGQGRILAASSIDDLLHDQRLESAFGTSLIRIGQDDGKTVILPDYA